MGENFPGKGTVQEAEIIIDQKLHIGIAYRALLGQSEKGDNDRRTYPEHPQIMPPEFHVRASIPIEGGHSRYRESLSADGGPRKALRQGKVSARI